MIISVINESMNTVQVINENGKYTCRTEIKNGELHFKFKNQWHRVSDYTTDTTSVFKKL